MQIGMIGLGRMGANMVRRLMRGGHECVVYDVSAEAVARAGEGEGATGATSLADFVEQARAAAAVVWMMIPAGVRRRRRSRRPRARFDAGDTIIDGGNSDYRDDLRRARRARANAAIHYIDVGTSGGVWGLERGYCLMIGGDDAAVQRLDPIFAALAPGRDAAPRTPGREESRQRPSRATCTAVRPAPATSSRWSTTGSSTGSWPRTPRA